MVDFTRGPGGPGELPSRQHARAHELGKTIVAMMREIVQSDKAGMIGSGLADSLLAYGEMALRRLEAGFGFDPRQH